jgi:hypothetical protein
LPRQVVVRVAMRAGSCFGQKSLGTVLSERTVVLLPSQVRAWIPVQKATVMADEVGAAGKLEERTRREFLGLLVVVTCSYPGT